MKRFVWLGLLMCWMASFPLAGWAEEKESAKAEREPEERFQRSVISLSMTNGFSFAQEDDVRKSLFTSPPQSPSGGHISVDVFLTESVAVGAGFVLVSQVSSKSSSLLFFSVPDEMAQVTGHLLTFTYLPWIAEDGYLRFGLQAGAGTARYKTSTWLETLSYDGQAGLGGAYFDWGGDGFGARLYAGVFKTAIKPVNGFHPDGSGSFATLELRWAF